MHADYEDYEKGRVEYAKLSPEDRRYPICMALNMTNLSIELERLERVGVAKEITERWKSRAMALLHDILDVSDIKEGPMNPPSVEARLKRSKEIWDTCLCPPAPIEVSLGTSKNWMTRCSKCTKMVRR